MYRMVSVKRFDDVAIGERFLLEKGGVFQKINTYEAYSDEEDAIVDLNLHVIAIEDDEDQICAYL